VPLWTDHADGEWTDGKINVPIRLCNTDPHSNERHEFTQLINSNIERWVEWKRKQGWVMTTKPKVSGPFNPPTEDANSPAPEDHKWYFVRARFKRVSPLYVGLDNFLEARRLAELHGIQTPKDPLPYNDPKDVETEWETGFKHAEAFFQKTGLRREDYII
jgi:hypothetical protein